MRILIGMPDPSSWGGVQACEPPFVAALRNHPGVEVTEETYVYGDKLRKTSIPGRIDRVLRTGARMRRVAGRGRFDLVHLNTAFDMKTVMRDLATVAMLGGSGARIFLKLHGSDRALLETREFVKRSLWRRLLGSVDGVGVLSSEERDNFIAAGVDPGLLHVVKNSIRLPERVPPRAFDQRPFRFLFVARFIPTKGLLESVRAAAIVRDAGRDFSLLCVGDGEVRAEAEALVRSLGLQEQVQFTGYVPESQVDQHYSSSDCLLFPTYHDEGFPMVIFNAMALGLPVITTRIRAARDQLSEPANCLWTAARSPEDTARQMLRMIDDADLRRAMSAQNMESARRFTAAAVAPEYVDIYRRLLAGTGMRARLARGVEGR